MGRILTVPHEKDANGCIELLHRHVKIFHDIRQFRCGYVLAIEVVATSEFALATDCRLTETPSNLCTIGLQNIHYRHRWHDHEVQLGRCFDAQSLQFCIVKAKQRVGEVDGVVIWGLHVIEFFDMLGFVVFDICHI